MNPTLTAVIYFVGKALQMIALLLAIVLMIFALVYGYKIQSAVNRLQHPQVAQIVPGCSGIADDAREGTNCDPTR